MTHVHWDFPWGIQDDCNWIRLFCRIAFVSLIVLPAVRATRAGLRLLAIGALAGILSAANLTGSSSGSSELLLSVVVATLLGMVFSRRLAPTIGGTLLAVLFIGLLANGFQLVNISSYWINGVQGVLILFMVASAALGRRRAKA